MNYSNYRLSFDIHDIVSNVVVKVKRGDNTRRLCISLTENGKVYEITEACTAVFKGKKPDGYSLYNECTIEDNCILYVIGNNTTSTVGIVECEISLIGDDGETITSPRFSILVEPTTVNDDDIFDSSDEVSALTALVSDTTALKNEIETKLANGEFTPKKGVDYYTTNDLAELDAKVEKAKKYADSANSTLEECKRQEELCSYNELQSYNHWQKAVESADDAAESATYAKACLEEIEAKKKSIVQDVIAGLLNGDEVEY